MEEYNTLVRESVRSFSQSGTLVMATQRFRAQIKKVVQDLEMEKLIVHWTPTVHPTIDKRRIAEDFQGLNRY